MDVRPAYETWVFATPGSRFAVAHVANGDQRELALYAAPLVTVGKAGTPWVRICDFKDGVTQWVVHGDDIYLLTYRDSTRYSVVRTRLSAPDFAKATTVMPVSERVLVNLAAAKDALYLEARDGTVKRLMRRPCDAPTGLVTTEVKVKSYDGALVPLSIIHRADLKLDGSNPTLLYGYGSYGITEEPGYQAMRLAWLERGGVYAVANVRGSSVYGHNWYKAGAKSNKPNTWKDFIACAEYLIAQKYTSSARLGILGGSAGGITVGRALTERPDLFAAVVPSVGVFDAVRAELEANGVPNIPEFGTVAKEDEFRALLAMSSYHHVKDGTPYPAVLLIHGVNDPRVDYWQSAKMAARLQAATSSGKPVLLDLDYD